MGYNDRAELSVLIGKTLVEARQIGGEEIILVTSEGETYKMYHNQDCCENVYIESIEGDLASLVGNPILVSEEVSGGAIGPIDDHDESYTWTFYKFATIKGHIDIRWYGVSNGYYSENVDFERVKP